MRYPRLLTLATLSFLSASAIFCAAPKMTTGGGTIGRNLQAYTTVTLSDPAPESGLVVTIKSNDPSKLLLAPMPDQAGTPSIQLTIKHRFRACQDFWLQALGGVGTVGYTVSAPGYPDAVGLVKLTPSAVVLIGPFGENVKEIITTPRGWPSKLSLRTVRLDAKLGIAEPQLLRGGLTLDLNVASSNQAVGIIPGEPGKITGPGDSATMQFKPVAAGTSTISLVPPPGFTKPAKHAELIATVKPPGISVADEYIVGENLQMESVLSLGEPAPPEGLVVTLTSNTPDKLLLALNATDKGSASINLKVPPSGISGKYYVQALVKEGQGKHTASAPGYSSRVGTLNFAPSGVILSIETHGPPDEAEIFRPESAGGPQTAFNAHLKGKQGTTLIVYSAYLDPVSKRTADITVQQLRGGLTLPIELENSLPAVGTVDSKITLNGGTSHQTTMFTPTSEGKTIIKIGTPEGFTKPSNFTELLAIVKP